jgi:hypothetical protein
MDKSTDLVNLFSRVKIFIFFNKIKINLDITLKKRRLV